MRSITAALIFSGSIVLGSVALGCDRGGGRAQIPSTGTANYVQPGLQYSRSSLSYNQRPIDCGLMRARAYYTMQSRALQQQMTLVAMQRATEREEAAQEQLEKKRYQAEQLRAEKAQEREERRKRLSSRNKTPGTPLAFSQSAARSTGNF